MRRCDGEFIITETLTSEILLPFNEFYWRENIKSVIIIYF